MDGEHFLSYSSNETPFYATAYSQKKLKKNEIYLMGLSICLNVCLYTM